MRTSASSSVEYPDWNATTFYHTPLNAQKVSGGWMNLLGNSTSFSSVGLYASPSVITSGEFSNLNGFVYLSNPRKLIHPLLIPMEMVYQTHGNLPTDFPLLKRMGRKIWTEIR